MIRWPDAEIAIILHRGVMEYVPEGRRPDPSGGGVVVRPDLLESALAAARHLHEYQRVVDIATLGAVLCARIALNHPFADGNKRAAVALMIHFLEENGRTIPTGRRMDLHDPLIGLIRRELAEDDFTEFIRAVCVPLG